MSLTRITILGAGSIALGPSVVAALANYFGERPFEICLWDADEERLDLMCRFAQTCCVIMKSKHFISMTSDLDEALEGADVAINIVDMNCAEHHFKRLNERHPDLEEKKSVLTDLALLPTLAQDWTITSKTLKDQLPNSSLIAEEPYEVALQLLRWARSEEYPFEFLKQFENSVVKEWLDQVTQRIISRE